MITEAEDITEQLKADDMMKWVGLMSNIHNRVQEIIKNELIYSYTKQRKHFPLTMLLVLQAHTHEQFRTGLCEGCQKAGLFHQ